MAQAAALTLLCAAVGVDGGDPVVWARLGRVALARARPVLARRAFERGLGQFP